MLFPHRLNQSRFSQLPLLDSISSNNNSSSNNTLSTYNTNMLTNTNNSHIQIVPSRQRRQAGDHMALRQFKATQAMST
jgi:hypothetical protein